MVGSNNTMNANLALETVGEPCTRPLSEKEEDVKRHQSLCGAGAVVFPESVKRSIRSDQQEEISMKQSVPSTEVMILDIAPNPFDQGNQTGDPDEAPGDSTGVQEDDPTHHDQGNGNH